MSPEIRERPIGFGHLGSSPFCEGESQTLKLPLTALFTQQTSVFGFVCSAKQKGLGTNLTGLRKKIDTAYFFFDAGAPLTWEL